MKAIATVGERLQLIKDWQCSGLTYGITDNSDMLNIFVYRIRWIMFKWLNRRSQRKSYNWKNFTELLKNFPLAKPRIYVSIYGD